MNIQKLFAEGIRFSAYISVILIALVGLFDKYKGTPVKSLTINDVVYLDSVIKSNIKIMDSIKNDTTHFKAVK